MICDFGALKYAVLFPIVQITDIQLWNHTQQYKIYVFQMRKVY